ncbi:MAG: ABC transporter permease [Armatimonadota bacterium]
MRKSAVEEVLYEPDNCLKQGYRGLIKDVFRDIVANHWLTLQILRRDIFAVYRQSAAGLLWLFINPLLMIGTFVILGRSKVFDLGDVRAPYPIYAVLGMSLWQLFAVGLTSSANSLVAAGSMIAKINFSKKSLVIASLGNSILAFLIQFAIVLVLFGVYHAAPKPHILLVPLLAIPMMLVTLGLGFIVALFNAVLRDVGVAIPVLIQFLLLLTPVLYAPRSGLIAQLTRYNPLYYLVSMPRDLAILGYTNHVTGYLIASVIAVFVFMVCLVTFHLTETRIAERV